MCVCVFPLLIMTSFAASSCNAMQHNFVAIENEYILCSEVSFRNLV